VSEPGETPETTSSVKGPPPASADEAPPGFFTQVGQRLIDLSPASLAASAIQWALLLGVAWALGLLCRLAPAWLLSTCDASGLAKITGVLPAVTLVVVGVLIMIAVVLLTAMTWLALPTIGLFVVVVVIGQLGLPEWLASLLGFLAIVAGIVLYYLFTSKIGGSGGGGSSGGKPDPRQM
jgi:hypothetical protein